jgi:dolichol kinase
MKLEISRQLVHLSGFLFIILAQFIGGILISLYCFLIAVTLFLYSELIKREQKKLYSLVDKIENRIREVVVKLETREVKRPFTGALWFFMGLGVTFLIFPMSPLNIASALGLILTVSDSLATIAGMRWGAHTIIGGKSLEGSGVFFVTSLIISLIILPPLVAVAAAITATIVELLPDTTILRRYKKAGYVDDNFLIPVLTGLVLMLLV